MSSLLSLLSLSELSMVCDGGITEGQYIGCHIGSNIGSHIGWNIGFIWGVIWGFIGRVHGLYAQMGTY